LGQQILNNPFKHPCILCIGMFLFAFFSCGESSPPPSNTDKYTISNKGKEENSFLALNKALKKEPNNAKLYYNRAKKYLEKNAISEAKRDIERALLIDSTESNFYYTKADIAFRQKQTREARTALQKSIDLNPKHIQAHLKLAEIYMLLEQYPTSIKWVDKALKIDVFNPKAYFQKGMTFKYAGDTTKAISSFQTSIEQNPDFFNVYIQLGLLFEKIDPLLALGYYDNAIRIQPSNIEAIYHKSYYLHFSLNKPRKALKGYELMRSIDPKNYQALFNTALSYLENLNKPDSALFFFNQIIAEHPKDYKVLYNIGLCYEDIKDIQTAKTYYKQSLSIKPDYTKAALRLNQFD